MNKSNFHPKVSIIIPVYNGSNYMREAINSALAQTYNNIEIIVVNDGSTDDTNKIAKSYGDKIRYFKKENGGVSSALNVGLREMKGDYFSWLSHDDVYYLDKIEKQVNHLSILQDKDVILYSNYDVINKKSKRIDRVKLNHHLLKIKPIYALLRSAISGSTLLIPKKAFDEYGFFDEKLKCTQDYVKWFEMMESYNFIHMQELLTKYRTHEFQDTVKNPLVLTEGNELWIKIIKSTPTVLREKLEKNELAFFKEMVFFLKKTPYTEAMNFANEEANKILISNGKKEIDFTKKIILPNKRELKNKIKFLFYSPKKLFKKYFLKLK